MRTENTNRKIWQKGLPSREDDKLVVVADRSSMNKRNSMSKTLDCASKFEKSGLRTEFRGKPMCMAPDSRSVRTPWDRDFLAGGTLVSAIAHSIQTKPENKYVKMIMKYGMPGCMDLVDNIPRVIQKWAKAEHNDFHDGWGYSVIEFYDDALESEPAWHKYKDAQIPPIKVNNCPSRPGVVNFSP